MEYVPDKTKVSDKVTSNQMRNVAQSTDATTTSMTNQKRLIRFFAYGIVSIAFVGLIPMGAGVVFLATHPGPFCVGPILVNSDDEDFYMDVYANRRILAAGDSGPRASGGGAPPSWVSFAPRAGAIITFSEVSGRISCCGRSERFTADGLDGQGTDVPSSRGLSGITHPNRKMFLVGLFSDGSLPRTQAPVRLDASDPKNLTPELFQTFFIGSGKEEYAVPPTASRLYLGFADSDPAAYDSNEGKLITRFHLGPKTYPCGRVPHDESVPRTQQATH